MLKKIQKAATLPQKLEQAPPPPPQKDIPVPAIPSVTPTSDSPTTLKKTRGTARSSSADLLPENDKLQPSRLQTRRLSPSPDARGRSSSAQPPTSRAAQADGSRILSGPALVALADSGESSPTHEPRGRLRRSWLPGGQSRSSSADLGKGRNALGAWVMSPGGTAEYSLSNLVNGEMVIAPIPGVHYALAAFPLTLTPRPSPLGTRTVERDRPRLRLPLPQGQRPWSVVQGVRSGV